MKQWRRALKSRNNWGICGTNNEDRWLLIEGNFAARHCFDVRRQGLFKL